MLKLSSRTAADVVPFDTLKMHTPLLSKKDRALHPALILQNLAQPSSVLKFLDRARRKLAFARFFKRGPFKPAPNKHSYVVAVLVVEDAVVVPEVTLVEVAVAVVDVAVTVVAVRVIDVTAVDAVIEEVVVVVLDIVVVVGLTGVDVTDIEVEVEVMVVDVVSEVVVVVVVQLSQSTGQLFLTDLPKIAFLQSSASNPPHTVTSSGNPLQI